LLIICPDFTQFQHYKKKFPWNKKGSMDLGLTGIGRRYSPQDIAAGLRFQRQPHMVSRFPWRRYTEGKFAYFRTFHPAIWLSTHSCYNLLFFGGGLHAPHNFEHPVKFAHGGHRFSDYLSDNEGRQSVCFFNDFSCDVSDGSILFPVWGNRSHVHFLRFPDIAVLHTRHRNQKHKDVHFGSVLDGFRMLRQAGEFLHFFRRDIILLCRTFA
jgi:hypothetical protein